MRYMKSSFCRISVLAACLAPRVKSGGKSYIKDETRSVQSVQRGVVIALDDVAIEQDSTVLGPGIGREYCGERMGNGGESGLETRFHNHYEKYALDLFLRQRHSTI